MHLHFLTCPVHESGKIRGQTFNLPSIEFQTAVVKATLGHGLIAVTHAFTLEDTLAILESGLDGLAHTFSDTPPTRELIDVYKPKTRSVSQLYLCMAL